MRHNRRRSTGEWRRPWTTWCPWGSGCVLMAGAGGWWAAGRRGPGDAGRITGRGGGAAGGRGGAAGRAASGGPQVIVVDDCSADPAAIKAIAAAAGARVIRRPVNGGPGAARNTGLAAAATPLVAFLDSDCVPAPGWLDALVPHFADPATGAAAPRIVPHDPERAGAGQGWLARYEGASSTLDMGARPSIVRPGARVSYVPGAALLVRRAAAGDGFQAGLHVGEDLDFVWRRGTAGWRARAQPAPAMAHPPPGPLPPGFPPPAPTPTPAPPPHTPPPPAP